MDVIGTLGIGLATVAIFVVGIAFSWSIFRRSDEATRILGFRIGYLAVATFGVGLSLFVVSRPDTKLAFPLNLIGGLFFLAFALRFALVANSFRTPRR